MTNKPHKKNQMKNKVVIECVIVILLLIILLSSTTFSSMDQSIAVIGKIVHFMSILISMIVGFMQRKLPLGRVLLIVTFTFIALHIFFWVSNN